MRDDVDAEDAEEEKEEEKEKEKEARGAATWGWAETTTTTTTTTTIVGDPPHGRREARSGGGVSPNPAAWRARRQATIERPTREAVKGYLHARRVIHAAAEEREAWMRRQQQQMTSSLT